METNRRHVLKGMALSSIAGFAISDSTRTLASATSSPLAVLINDDAVGALFLRGAVAANGSSRPLQSRGCDVHFMLDLERRLRSRDAMRIIGLLDDASGTLVVDVARSAGARVPWLGQHSAHAGYTRHRLLHAEVAEDCSRRFARQLQACGVGFHIVDERRDATSAQRHLSAPPRGSEREWVSSIGSLLASLERPSMAAPSPSGNVVAEGHFVSFSIEI